MIMDELSEQFRDALARALGREMALQKENQRLREALQGLIDGVVPEVNDKGAGGYLLARLTDARNALGNPDLTNRPKSQHSTTARDGSG